MRCCVLLSYLLIGGVVLPSSYVMAGAPPAPTITPLVRTVDLELGQSCTVTSADRTALRRGSRVSVRSKSFTAAFLPSDNVTVQD